jgi:hypothetical protein
MAHGGKRPGAGRPKGSLNKMTFKARQLASRHLDALIAEQARLALKAKSEGVRNSAIASLLDRIVGRARPAVEDAIQIPTRITVEWDPTKAEPMLQRLFSRAAEKHD